MLEKRNLRRRYNVWWARVKVPNRVRHIIGKSELKKNLFTTSLKEANIKKHRVIAEFKEMINLAEKRLDGSFNEFSKEDQLRHAALEYRKHKENSPEDEKAGFNDVFDAVVEEIYGH